MAIITAMLEGMFVRGGRKDNFLLFLFGQASLIILSILGSMYLINNLAYSNVRLVEILGPFKLFGNMAVMTAFALMIWVHEIGHYAQLRRYDVPTFGILLPPLGGVMVPGYILSPAKHIEVALGGPLTGVVGLPLLIVGLTSQSHFGGLLILLGFTWVGINLLNLLPIFPMDGGLILVELLSYWIPRKTAIKIAIGLSLLTIFGLLLIVGQWTIMAAQLALVLLLLVVDSGATKLFYWFSRDYLKIEQPPIVPLTREEVLHYASVYLAVFTILSLITWLTLIYNPFKFV